MVAYSFDRRFVDQIVLGTKCQTIRAHSRRHARPGERLQLYTGMRTKACRLIRDDVVCSRVDEARFDLRGLADAPMPVNTRQLSELIDSVELPFAVNGMPLSHVARLALAMQDGFAGWVIGGKGADGITVRPFDAMVLYWMGTHGAGLFEGVMISWERPA